MKSLLLLLGALALAGCSTVPTSIVQRPTTVRPMLAEQPAPTNGAIYQASSYRPMFEDRRARHIGDMLTINIVEKTSAVKAGASSGNKTGGVSIAMPKPLQSTFGNPLAVSNESSFSDGDNQSASIGRTDVGCLTIDVGVDAQPASASAIVAPAQAGIQFLNHAFITGKSSAASGRRW